MLRLMNSTSSNFEWPKNSKATLESSSSDRRLSPRPLTKPPSSPGVPAMQLQQQYSLKSGAFRAIKDNYLTLHSHYAHMSSGMSRRPGDNARLSMALFGCHILWIDRHFDDLYHSSAVVPCRPRQCYCLAGLNQRSRNLWSRPGATEPHLEPTVDSPPID